MNLFVEKVARAVRDEKLPSASVWQCWSWSVLVESWATSLKGSDVLAVMDHALMGLIRAQAFVIAEAEVRRKMDVEESDDEEMDDVLAKGKKVEKVPTKEEEKEAQARKEILASIESPAFISMVLAALEVCTTIFSRCIWTHCDSLPIFAGKIRERGGGSRWYLHFADDQPRQRCGQYADVVLQDGLQYGLPEGVVASHLSV